MNLSRHHRRLAPIGAHATRSNPKRAPKPTPKRAPKPAPKRTTKPTPKRAPKPAPKRAPKPAPKRTTKPQAPARRGAPTMIDLRAEPPTLELWLNLSAGTDAALWDAIEESEWTPQRPFELGELSERMAAEIRREIADAIGVENLNDLVFPDGSMVNVPEEIELTVLKSEPTPGGLFGTTWEFHTRVRFPEPMRNWPNEETRENPAHTTRRRNARAALPMPSTHRHPHGPRRHVGMRPTRA